MESSRRPAYLEPVLSTHLGGSRRVAEPAGGAGAGAGAVAYDAVPCHLHHLLYPWRDCPAWALHVVASERVGNLSKARQRRSSFWNALSYPYSITCNSLSCRVIQYFLRPLPLPPPFDTLSHRPGRTHNGISGESLWTSTTHHRSSRRLYLRRRQSAKSVTLTNRRATAMTIDRLYRNGPMRFVKQRGG